MRVLFIALFLISATSIFANNFSLHMEKGNVVCASYGDKYKSPFITRSNRPSVAKNYVINKCKGFSPDTQCRKNLTCVLNKQKSSLIYEVEDLADKVQVKANTKNYFFCQFSLRDQKYSTSAPTRLEGIIISRLICEATARSAAYCKKHIERNCGSEK